MKGSDLRVWILLAIGFVATEAALTGLNRMLSQETIKLPTSDGAIQKWNRNLVDSLDSQATPELEECLPGKKTEIKEKFKACWTEGLKTETWEIAKQLETIYHGYTDSLGDNDVKLEILADEMCKDPKVEIACSTTTKKQIKPVGFVSIFVNLRKKKENGDGYDELCERGVKMAEYTVVELELTEGEFIENLNQKDKSRFSSTICTKMRNLLGNLVWESKGYTHPSQQKSLLGI